MGRTLFWYVFKDLLKIFFMTSGALAGIMSFGGLLRPLTQQGLDASQVAKMLAYFTPAMTAYSFPIAALFAASVVYGRLSADNELTACRAGGISLGPIFGMAFPGLVFGLLVALVSLLFLCFIVPNYTLRVEKVVYSNLAKLIANRIERTHEIRFASANVFAQRAYLPPPDPKNPTRQQVVLEGVSIVQYVRAENQGAAAHSDSKVIRYTRVPKEFLLASSATIDISERDDEQVSLIIGLEGGTKFPRTLPEGMTVGIDATQFGPVEIPSPIKEDTKFMDVLKLNELYNKPEESRRIRTVIAEFVERDQVRQYLTQIRDKLNGGTRFCQFASDNDPKNTKAAKISITLDPTQEGVSMRRDGRPTTLPATLPAGPATPADIQTTEGDELVYSGKGPGSVMFERSGDDLSFQSAKELRIRVRPDNVRKLFNITVELLGRSPGGSGKRPVGNYSALIAVPMPPELQVLNDRLVSSYLVSKDLTKGDRERLGREYMILTNNILAESNGRASFAVSCFILVLVGCALGMMFRSGNFLTAFAVSFVPAVICITLIVAGQQTCHAVPWKVDAHSNPLRLGLALIWSGNVINLAIAGGLLGRLQRQ